MIYSAGASEELIAAANWWLVFLRLTPLIALIAVLPLTEPQLLVILS